MQRKIKLGDQVLNYRLKKSFKAKCIRLTINNQGELSAILPWFCSLKSLEKFLKQKSSWIEKNIKKNINKDNILDKGTKKDYLLNKERARRMVEVLIKEYNNFYGFEFNRICIRNQKTRWGSCSSNRNLNFNWRIVWLDPDCARYLVVHELCHLEELNHSKNFWRLVERQVPDYKIIRKKLRDV
ncbi:MAG: DUF45 domain-containing protein [Candidatus Moranbacteria bacterium]|nr:DUF45 domain-containing protein [Candidatus Moranbacteria bacterium]